MSSRRRFIGTGAAAIALAGMAARPTGVFAQDTTNNQGNTSPVVGNPTFNPAIGLIEAQEIALEGNDGAVVTEVELKSRRGVLTYTIELDDRIDVYVDATTGEILGTDADDDDDDDDDGRDDDDDNGDDDGDDDGGDDDDDDD